MKRIIGLCLILALAIGMVGCGAVQETEPSAEASTEAATAATRQVVTNMDDFLAAIAPGAEIVLGAGDFVLSDATDYGCQESSPYYVWVSMGDGYELQLQDVNDLTIQGSGKGKTRLIATPRSANVLTLQGCERLTLEGLTLGHREQAEACEGGVLSIERCLGIVLEDVGLFGCGTLGIRATESSVLSLTDCEIYDCSIGGIALLRCGPAIIQDCLFHDLADSFLFDINSSANVTVTDCVFRDNAVSNLLISNSSSSIWLRNNTFTGNSFLTAAFYLSQSQVILDSNQFEDNRLRHWYDIYSDLAVDPQGVKLPFEDAVTDIAPVVPATATPVSTVPQTQVHVSTADQLLGAIASDTEIILDAELYDLSSASNYGINGTCYYWEDNFDGPSLVIEGIDNLTIRSGSNDRTASTISAVPRYANVLTFENCSAITLSGFTAGHTKEPGYCLGGVLSFRNCENMLVENCGLFGCGTLGVQSDYSRGIQIINSEIYECSYGGVSMTRTEDVTIGGTTFRDLGGNTFSFYDCSNVTQDGSPIDGNYHGN